MPRKKKEVLSTDNDAAVQAVKSEEFLSMNDSEALDVALALQQILRGQGAILNRQDEFADELRKMKAQMKKYDKAAEKYENNREKYIQEVLDKAASLKATGSEKDKLVAQGTLQLQEAIKEARAKNASDKMVFEENLRRMPKVTVVSPGVWVSGSASGGAPVHQIVPEEIRIKHLRWVLPPGKPVEVPEVVAKALEDRRRSDAETAERQAALSKIQENDKLTQEISEINNKYKTNSVQPFQSE